MNVLIAGGTGELGMALAEGLIARGHTPIVFGRSEERAERARARLGSKAVVLVGDGHDEDSVAQVVTEAKRLGDIDAFVHNAGFGDVPERLLEQWHLDTFLEAQMRSERALLALLRLAQPQVVLLLLGNLALTPVPGRAVALATRLAIIGILRTWETERPGRRFTLVKMGKREGRFHTAPELVPAILAALFSEEREITVGDTYGS
jgi:NAD(P)-dependent dehydrogenase (short-subunit alcohol dehydrogenase family)